MSADIEVAAMENANKPEQTGPEPCSDHVEPNQETFLAPAPSSPSDQVRYVLVLFQDFHLGNFGSLAPDLAVHLRRKLEDIITAPQENVQIDLWLESGGGNAHSAYKIALLLRAYASRLLVVVPDFAKSAATLLALAADEIYMGLAAELGPLDAQIPNEGGIVTMISALDVARSLEELTETSMAQAFKGGADVLQITGLSRAESLEAMLTFSAQFMEPIIRQMDPRMIHWSSTLLDVAMSYGTRLLSGREGAGPHPEAENIPRSLVEDYPSHGFVISREEAAGRLGLPVHCIREYDLCKEVTALHRTYEDGRVNVIELMTLEEALSIRGGGGQCVEEGG